MQTPVPASLLTEELKGVMLLQVPGLCWWCLGGKLIQSGAVPTFVCGFVVSVLQCTLTSTYRSGEKDTTRGCTWAAPIGRRGLPSPDKHPRVPRGWGEADLAFNRWYFVQRNICCPMTSTRWTRNLSIPSPPLLPKWINPLQIECVLKTEAAETPWSSVNVLWQQVPFQNPETGVVKARDTMWRWWGKGLLNTA